VPEKGNSSKTALQQDWAALGQVLLRDTERAAQNLAHIAERVPPGVAAAVPPLLCDLPDPDAALNLFERLTATAEPELFRLLDRQRALVHYALVVFGYSQFLGETLIQNPDVFPGLVREKALDRSWSREDYRESFARVRSRSFETDVSLLLARFKRREYVRIMLRDVLGIATLAEATAEISALADVLIEEALRDADAALRARYGPPQHRDPDGRLVDTPVAVLAMGKLGGNELNYSSDVDLLFLYGDGEDVGTASISLREYFIRLAQNVTETLSRITREGSAFRIDLRLRPQGGEGEPAVALGQALRYYAEVAHDWELQAMIKARHCAGETALARRFLRGVQPLVYRQQINFAAVETALETRDRIRLHRRRIAARGGIDVKLDRGGIRDIEFLVQCLQRVYGGKEPWLRSGGTLFSLQKLHDKGHLGSRDFHELNNAYEFLRKLEHRLQLRRGQQTHRLPQARPDLEVIYRAMGGAELGENGAETIVTLVEQRMAAVAEIYNRIIHHQQLQLQREDGEFQLQATALELGREQSDQQILERLAGEAPELYRVAARSDLPGPARRNLFRFLTAAFTSSERYAVVAKAPQAVERALTLFGASDYLTGILIRHPEEIATLGEIAAARRAEAVGKLFEPAPEVGGAPEGDPVFQYLGSAPASLNEKLALLRRHYRHRVFASGARDLLEAREVFESLRETTAAADEAIAAALAIAGKPEGFAVLALGRLGTMEFDLLSDADLLFLRDPALAAGDAARTAEHVMHALSAYTREGTAFPVDLRLRPRGAEGELVMTPAHLENYFRHEAQAWEALTFTKLRFITGSAALAERARDAVGALMERFAADPGFLPAVREMRQKLEKAEAGPNFKTCPGGLYDIDFAAAQLLVRHGLWHTPGNIRERLGALLRRGLLGEAEHADLARAAELLRSLEHAVRLVTGRARKSLPVGGQALQATEEMVARVLKGSSPKGLEEELDRVFQGTRRIYEQLVSAK
jgi:glutamate-ammonia-ligase adenylyltransferase